VALMRDVMLSQDCLYTLVGRSLEGCPGSNHWFYR
jgi:hypothetical protein